MRRSMQVLVGACVLLLAATPAAARQHDHHDMAMPQTGLRAELILNVERLEQRYLALGDALTAHYAWRPGEGVRSTSEVLMHVAMANFMVPTMIGIQAPASAAGATEAVTDAAAVREHLTHSFRHARHVIAMTSDAQLDEEVTLFGQPTTRRGALTLLVNHMHEHLGQLIAYARVNGVVPPWSGD